MQKTEQRIFLNYPTCLTKKKKNQNTLLDATESISKKNSMPRGNIVKQHWVFVFKGSIPSFQKFG
jgi:hypothetical protein